MQEMTSISGIAISAIAIIVVVIAAVPVGSAGLDSYFFTEVLHEGELILYPPLPDEVVVLGDHPPAMMTS